MSSPDNLILSNQEAIKIAEGMLKKTGDALNSGDFDSFAACFTLPLSYETFDGHGIAKTSKDLRALFDLSRRNFELSGASDLVRRVLVADFITPDKIVATHESRLMRGSQMIEDPYVGMGTLVLIDGEWKISDRQYAVKGILGVGPP